MLRIWGIVLAGLLLLADCSALPHPSPRPSDRTSVDWRTADADDFRPGMLVGDALFYDSRSVRVAEVQRFLEARACVPEDDVPCLADYWMSIPGIARRTPVARGRAPHGSSSGRAAPAASTLVCS